MTHQERVEEIKLAREFVKLYLEEYKNTMGIANFQTLLSCAAACVEILEMEKLKDISQAPQSEYENRARGYIEGHNNLLLKIKDRVSK